MQTKLTLKMEKHLMEMAKKYASLHGKSDSKMVEDYFMLLEESTSKQNEELTPIMDPDFKTDI